MSARAVAAARRFLGTPYVPGACLAGAGCDCVGLLRGVWADLTGRPPPPVPGWRADWAGDAGRPLAAAFRTHLRVVPVAEAGPGMAVAFRADRAGRLEHHCGILAPDGRLIHAAEGLGVVEVGLGFWAARITLAGRFPES